MTYALIAALAVSFMLSLMFTMSGMLMFGIGFSFLTFVVGVLSAVYAETMNNGK